MSMLSRFAASGGVPAYADIQVVEGGSSLGGTATPISFGDVTTNDVVMLFVAYMPNSTTNTHSIPAGYIEVGGGTLVSGGQPYKYSWHYKVIGSVPDDGINLNDSNADGSGFTYYVCRNVDTSSPILASNTVVNATTDNPDPVTTTTKSLVITTAIGANGAGQYQGAPAGYSGFQQIDVTAFSDMGVASAYKALTSGATENPGQFTRSGSFSNYVALTVALKPALAAASIGTTIPSYVSANMNAGAGATVTVGAPTGIQNGDLLVAIGSTENSGTSIVTAIPSGFNLLTQKVGNPTVFVASKIASNESGNYSFTFSATTGSSQAIVLVYRNANYVNIIGNINSGSSASSVTAASITPRYRGTLVGVFAITSTAKSPTAAPSGMTERFVNSSNGRQYDIYDASPQELVSSGDKTLTWGGGGGAFVQGLLLQVTYEPDISPTYVDSSKTQNTSSGTSLVLNRPANTTSNDIMVAFCMTAGGTTTGWTGPAGWNEVLDSSSGRPINGIYYKIANTSEANSYTFTTAQSRPTSGAILTYRNGNFEGISTLAAAATTMQLPETYCSFPQSLLVAIAARDVGSITVSPHFSMTQRVSDSDATSPSYVICDQLIPAGKTGTRHFTFATATNSNGIMLIIKPTRSY